MPLSIEFDLLDVQKDHTKDVLNDKIIITYTGTQKTGEEV